MGPSLRDRFAGVLLGTAIGDALGLPMEGMSARAIARLYPKIDRYSLFGRTGFVSDDTEQTALVAQSLARFPDDEAGCTRAFRRSLLGWFLRLPWGIGWGTLRACVRIMLGLRESGVRSAGNGAAMRAAIVGVFFFDDDERRRRWARALARVTHTDPRAIDGAIYVAELAARCAKNPDEDLDVLVRDASAVIDEPTLRAAVLRARELAAGDAAFDFAARELGTTGFVLHAVPLATLCFMRFGREPTRAIVSAIEAGGDTDSNAAIVGAWMGALHGEAGLPADWITRLNDGPFGPTHLRALAFDLVAGRNGEPAKAHYSWMHAFARNVALYPIVLFHAVRVLIAR